MSVSIKTEHEIELMREAGHLLEKVHDGLIPYIKPGVSTKEIDRIGEQMIRDLGCIPNFLNYGGFPASFCISLNDEVVHGIPSEEKIIQEGDLVKIDAGLIYKGYHSDTRQYAVTKIPMFAMQCSNPLTTNPEIHITIIRNLPASLFNFIPQSTPRQTKKLQSTALKNICPSGILSLFPINPAK